MVFAGTLCFPLRRVNCVIHSHHAQWKRFAQGLAAGRYARADAAGMALSARAGAEMTAR